jgi:hypothetical protein
VPADERLAAVGIETVVVERGGGEARIPGFEEGERAVVEALAGQRHVVGVEHPVGEPRCHPFGRQPGHPLHQLAVEGHQPRLAVAVDRRQVRVVNGNHVAQQPLQLGRPTPEQQPFAGAEAQVGAGGAHHHRTGGGGGFIAAPEVFTGFDQRLGAGPLGAQVLQLAVAVTQLAAEEAAAVPQQGIGAGGHGGRRWPDRP